MNALHIRTTELRDPTNEYIDVVLALEFNVGLGCNNEDAEGLVELVDEAEEIELKSNPFEFHEDSVKSSTFLGGNDGQAEPGLMIDPSHSSKFPIPSTTTSDLFFGDERSSILSLTRKSSNLFPPFSLSIPGVTEFDLKQFDGTALVMSPLCRKFTDFDLKWFDAPDSVLSLSCFQVTGCGIKCFACPVSVSELAFSSLF